MGDGSCERGDGGIGIGELGRCRDGETGRWGNAEMGR